MHDGLQYGGKGSDADAGAYEYGVLGAEDVTRGRSVGSIDVNLWKHVVNSYFARKF